MRKGRVLKTFQGTTCNYKSVQLSKRNVCSKHLVHRLVAQAFLGLDTSSKMEVNHIDGDRFNNRVSNLEVVTHQQNIDHSRALGLNKDYGENHKRARLTNEQASQARSMWANGIQQKDIAKHFKVCKQTICNVVRHKTYIQ